MTDATVNPNANNDANSNALTLRQFINFETIAAGLFALFISVVAYLWNNHDGEFKRLSNDVRDINRIIPTLATKIEMNARFDKVDEKFAKIDEKFEKIDEKFEKMNKKMDDKFAKMDDKFDKVNDKLNTLILSMNTFQNTMATKAQVDALAKKVAANTRQLANQKVTH